MRVIGGTVATSEEMGSEEEREEPNQVVYS